MPISFHLANNDYLVDLQGLSESYHESWTSYCTQWINQDSYNFAVNPNVCIFFIYPWYHFSPWISTVWVCMWSLHLFPAMMVLLEMSLNCIMSRTPIYILVMIFCVIIFCQACWRIWRALMSLPRTTRMHLLVVWWICWGWIFRVELSIFINHPDEYTSWVSNTFLQNLMQSTFLGMMDGNTECSWSRIKWLTHHSAVLEVCRNISKTHKCLENSWQYLKMLD